MPISFHIRTLVIMIPMLMTFSWLGHAQAAPDGWISLFNGRNLDGWYSFLLTAGKSNDAKHIKLRVQDRSNFVPGRFICPHSACFDHEGNIFVVEWVEAGRVTKLRRVV